MTDREDRIRARAYALWEASGKPSGSEMDHWSQAEREIDAEEGAAARQRPAQPEETVTPTATKRKRAPAKRKTV